MQAEISLICDKFGKYIVGWAEVPVTVLFGVPNCKKFKWIATSPGDRFSLPDGEVEKDKCRQCYIANVLFCKGEWKSGGGRLIHGVSEGTVI